MSKQSGRALTLDVPMLTTCMTCKGVGKVKGLFHEFVCDGCGGAGLVDKATGQRVEPELLLVAMRREMQRLRGVIAELRRKDADECPIYGPMKTIRGGKFRGD